MHLTLCTSIVLIHLSSIDSNSMEKEEKNFTIEPVIPQLLGETIVLKFKLTSQSQLTFRGMQKIISQNNTKIIDNLLLLLKFPQLTLSSYSSFLLSVGQGNGVGAAKPYNIDRVIPGDGCWKAGGDLQSRLGWSQDFQGY